MRHLWLSIIATLLLSVLIGGSPVLANSHPAENTNTEIKLSVEQKSELEKIHKDLFQNKKALISKYVDYGVMTKEQGQKIHSRFDQRFQQLEKNGFVPTWDKSEKHRKSNCH